MKKGEFRLPFLFVPTLNCGKIIETDFHGKGDDIFNDETTRVISEVWLWDTLALLDEHGIDTTNNDLNHDLTIILQLIDSLIYRYKDKKHD